MTTTTQRTVHLVGALAAADAREAMEVPLSLAGPYLKTLADGETGQRSWWIAPYLMAFGQLDAVENADPDADWSDYAHVAYYRLRPGAELTAGDIESCIPIAGAFESSWPVFRELRDRYGQPGLRFQVGVPSPMDFAWDAFRRQEFADDSWLTSQLYEAFMDAYTHQVQRCQQLSGGAQGEIVFQLETPLHVAQVVTAAPGNKQKVAEEAARQLTGLAARSAPGTRWGFHLCYGDFHHKALSHPGSCADVVLLANEIAAAWPGDQTLDYIHLPFAEADQPPALYPGHYAPLRDLALPAGTQFMAGFVHESLDLDAHRELLSVIEDSYREHQVGVSTTCGLGRRPDQAQVDDALRKLAVLATA